MLYACVHFAASIRFVWAASSFMPKYYYCCYYHLKGKKHTIASQLVERKTPWQMRLINSYDFTAKSLELFTPCTCYYYCFVRHVHDIFYKTLFAEHQFIPKQKQTTVNNQRLYTLLTIDPMPMIKWWLFVDVYSDSAV